MKKIMIILTATLFITLTAKGQNLFFIGEGSYPCTESITLQSNSTSAIVSDLNVLFAKDGTTGLFVVGARTITEVFISGKLIIYLDDGAVIICKSRVIYDYIDNTAISVYSLTNKDLSKMKNSNINTVRYELKSDESFGSAEDGNYSASNKETQTKTLITEFFGE